ncbi:MAG: SDR family oxidoreductase [Acidobacteriota bacterium]|nr:SDR family oxidoreductase [Acidobacteriota bacterium]
MVDHVGHRLSLHGKNVVVVGASAGIGKQAAIDMVEMGGEVVFAGRNAAKLEESLFQAGGGYAVIADIAEPDDCERLIAEAVNHLGGRIDLLLTVVGVSRLGLVRDASPELWKECLLTNVMGPALVTRAAIPHLTPGAFVGYFSSESVGMPYPGLVPYGSSKAALEEMIRGVRAEHPEFRVSCLRVGATSDTDFARDFDPDLAAQLTPKWIERGNIPNNFMSAVGLGRAIARICALATEFAEVDFQDLVLRGTGGPYYGGSEALMAQLESSVADTHRRDP